MLCSRPIRIFPDANEAYRVTEYFYVNPLLNLDLDTSSICMLLEQLGSSTVRYVWGVDRIPLENQRYVRGDSRLWSGFNDDHSDDPTILARQWTSIYSSESALDAVGLADLPLLVIAQHMFVSGFLYSAIVTVCVLRHLNWKNQAV